MQKFWFEIPPVKKNELNEKIQILTKFIAKKFKNKQVLSIQNYFLALMMNFQPILKMKTTKV